VSDVEGIRPVRRVVASRGGDGGPRLVFDGDSPHVTKLPGMPDTLGLTDVWASSGMPPSPRSGDDDAVPAQFAIAPEPGGTLFRLVQFPPASAGMEPLWHQTDTLDYNVVVSGELWLLIDGAEARLGPGDCVVVDGIRHAWDNRAEEIATLGAVSIAARTTEAGSAEERT